jgi:hypothetical protein
MDKQAVKDITYGGISELMRNPNYYYFSSVGSAYSYWTENGKQALQEYMDLMAHQFREVELADLDQRAKELVLKGLKGDEV